MREEVCSGWNSPSHIDPGEWWTGYFQKQNLWHMGINWRGTTQAKKLHFSKTLVINCKAWRHFAEWEHSPLVARPHPLHPAQGPLTPAPVRTSVRRAFVQCRQIQVKEWDKERGEHHIKRAGAKSLQEIWTPDCLDTSLQIYFSLLKALFWDKSSHCTGHVVLSLFPHLLSPCRS